MKKTKLLWVIISLAIFFLSVNQNPIAAAEDNISISKALFVKEANGYGLYEKEEDNHFISGSSTGVYIELENFSVSKGEELFVTDILVRLDVLNGDNKVAFTSDEVFTIKEEFKSQRKDLSFKVPLDFSKWKTGKYTLKFTVFDNIRQQTCNKNMPLEIF